MSFALAPAQQSNWDWRAAANFICGGAGSGLIAFAALAGSGDTTVRALVALGIALVGTGLFCVWLEIGRPWRALHVFFNPRTSWMSREAYAATLLVPVAASVVAGYAGLAPIAAALALVFAYCQGRMVRAARGIAAWREPLVPPLFVLTALAEGGGLFVLASAFRGITMTIPAVVLAMLVLLRAGLWLAYRRRVRGSLPPRALAHLDTAGRGLLWFGTALPLASMLGAMIAGGAPIAFAVAGAAATAAGSWFKLILVTRAGFNQGFVLAHTPVRGKRRDLVRRQGETWAR